jgi:hypothetical protein
MKLRRNRAAGPCGGRMKSPTEDGDGATGRRAAWTPAPSVVLAIDADPILAALTPLPETTHVVRTRFRDLGPDLIARTLPDCIVSPLIAAEFDAVELAQRICEYGYRGRLLVCARDMPNDRIIRAELNGACAGLDIDLLDLGSRA